MASGNKIRIKVDDQASKTLKAMRGAVRSPEIIAEVQRGTEIMALAVRQRAPMQKGLLRKGVYTASAVRNNFSALSRGGKKMNSALRYPPRKGQVLLVSSVYYGLWIEKGRTPRKADPTRAAAHERRAVGKMNGRKRGRPFFQPAVRSSRATAESYIRRRIDRILQEKADK